jgi:hypothetical protein
VANLFNLRVAGCICIVHCRFLSYVNIIIINKKCINFASIRMLYISEDVAMHFNNCREKKGCPSVNLLNVKSFISEQH